MSRLRISSIAVMAGALLISACDAAPNTSSADDSNAENDAVAEVNTAGPNNASFETNADASQNTGAGEVSGQGDTYEANYDVVPGVGVFAYPVGMEIGEWYILEFAAGPSQSAVSQETEGLPTTQPKPIYLSRVMRVTLLGDSSFEIKPKGEAVQDMGADRTASWQWDVKAVADGTHYLVARVDVLRKGATGEYEVIDQYTRRVTLRVKVGTWQGFLDALRNASTLGDALATLFRSWEKTLLALAALIGASFIVLRTIRRRKEA